MKLPFAGVLALLLAPVAFAAGSFEHDGLVLGPNVPGFAHEALFQLDVLEGQRLSVDLRWDDADGSLYMFPNFVGDGEFGCTIGSSEPGCFVDDVVEFARSDVLCPGITGNALSRSPLHMDATSPLDGFVVVQVLGGISTGDVPFHISIALDGEAPAAVQVTQHDTILLGGEGGLAQLCL